MLSRHYLYFIQFEVGNDSWNSGRREIITKVTSSKEEKRGKVRLVHNANAGIMSINVRLPEAMEVADCNSPVYTLAELGRNDEVIFWLD